MISFVWGRIRYDVVALTALVAAVLLGVVQSGNDAFMGFSAERRDHRGDGLDHLQGHTEQRRDRPARRAAGERFGPAAAVHGHADRVSLRCCQGFMNNVGALALLMPVAISLSKRPSQILMPLSFGTILGGLDDADRHAAEHHRVQLPRADHR